MWAAVLAVASLSGCASAPGMFLGASEDGRSKGVLETWLGRVDPEIEAAPAAPLVPYKLLRLSAETLPAAQSAAPAQVPAALQAASVPHYRLGSQDVLRIDVWGHPDLSVASAAPTAGVANPLNGRVINEQGQVYFPLVGLQQAAGLTAAEFRANLTRALAKFLKEPQVEVSVASYRSQRVFVAGEVRTPGVLPITDVPLRVTDALGQVGGATNEADLGQVQITRGSQTFALDLNQLYYGGNTAANVLLAHGDVLTVPDRQSRKVFLLGELTQPKSLLLRRGRVTLAEVLGDVGGPNPLSSNAGQVFVIRADANSNAVVYQLDAREPTALVLADRFELRPRDMVYVNPTSLTRLGRTIAQLLPTLTGVNAVKTASGL